MVLLAAMYWCPLTAGQQEISEQNCNTETGQKSELPCNYYVIIQFETSKKENQRVWFILFALDELTLNSDGFPCTNASEVFCGVDSFRILFNAKPRNELSTDNAARI